MPCASHYIQRTSSTPGLRSAGVSTNADPVEAESVTLPSPCLVILVGPAGVGKSTWAAAQFSGGQVVSTDALRGMVGESPNDQAASKDAFALVDEIVIRRLRRGLTTVIDSLGMDAPTRARWRAMATTAGVPCIAAVFHVVAAEVRARNLARPHPVPDRVVRGMLDRWPTVVAEVAAEPFDQVITIRPDVDVTISPIAPARARRSAAPSTPAAVARHQPLKFGLQIPRYEFPGGPAELAGQLQTIARRAESAGFDQLWVMDHFRQIPQMGRAWDNMLDSWTTLAYLAGVTETIRLGTLVTGITYRNIAHLAKIVATLDVLSGGRAICGLGAAWFRQEHDAYGWPFPSTAERFAMLEDALQLLPLMWGPGTPRFEGRTITVPEAICYPRPLQAKVPILIGGSGEKTTLRLVAQYADACNLFGDEATVRRKVEALHRHCAAAQRPPTEIDVTHLSTVLVGDDSAHTTHLVETLRPPRAGAERFARSVNAGSVDEHIDRIERFVVAGVDTIIVSLADLGPESIGRYQRVIAGSRAASGSRSAGTHS